MIFRSIFPVLSMLAFAAPVMAQQSGGIALPPGISGPHGLARPLLSAPAPYQTAQSVQNGMTPADHQAANQAAISSLRGDAGFLAGFAFGTPQAASRQIAQSYAGDSYGYDYRRRHHGQGQRTTIINNTGPLALTVGNGNVVQQQGATGSGPTAQQQVATVGGVALGSGATNRVLANGNILQSAPGISR